MFNNRPTKAKTIGEVMYLSNNILKLIALTFLVTLLWASSSQAGLPRGGNILDTGESFHPHRGEVRLNLMGEWSDTTESHLEAVCRDLLEEDKTYHLNFAPVFQFGNVAVEPTIGWVFQEDDEFLVALRIRPEWAGFQAYSNTEYSFESKSYYYLTQAYVRVSPFLEWGVEAEGWGDFENHLTSNGLGVNLAFNFHPRKGWGKKLSKLRVEAFCQAREMDGHLKPAVGIRFSVTPKMDAHSPSRRRY
jgi:hypothetical protein